MLIEKIAYHIADFTPRLRGNNRAMYQYCGIPTIRYQQLQSELFCNIYYLRHLCDVTRFPDWPIKDPVILFPISLTIDTLVIFFKSVKPILLEIE